MPPEILRSCSSTSESGFKQDELFLPCTGETSRNNQPPPLASFIPFYLHLNFSQQADRVIISDGSRFSLSNTVFSPCVRNNGVGFILAINEFITLLERGDFFDWNQFTQKSGTVPPNLTESSDFRVFAVRCIAPSPEKEPP